MLWACRTGLVLVASTALLLSGCADDEVLFDPAETPSSPVPDASGSSPAASGLLEAGDQVVVVGDSLPVLADPGGEPWPALLDERLASDGPADVEVENLAVPGTTVDLWSPGSELWADRLEPALDEADVLLVQLGGNDLQRAVGGLAAPADLAPAELPDLDEVVGTVVDDLDVLLDAVAERRPDLRVLFVGYPDYSRTDPYDDAPPAVAGAVRAALQGLDDGVEATGDAEAVRFVDATAEESTDVDDLLRRDGIHLGSAGHELYVDALADALTAP